MNAKSYRAPGPPAFQSRLFQVPRHGMEHVLLVLLGFSVFTSAFVLLDILYSLFILSTIGLFVLFGLRVDRANIPLILFLITINLGGLIALQPYLNLPESTEFMVGTCFVATTGIFFALALNENAMARLGAIKWGLIFGGLAAATAGVLGATDIAGLGTLFSMYEGRASGTFKDPNVFGSFLVMPALLLMSDILNARRLSIIKVGMFGIVMLGLFLSFSRGSWAAMVIGMGLLMGMMFITAAHQAIRARLMLLGLAGLCGLALAFAAILSVDSIAAMFADRFTLQKDYDSGPSGRFGTQLRSIPDLLTLPFGHGPFRFWMFYPENPHNMYLNAFSNYGWLGGIAHLGFTITTLVITFRAALQRTPFQAYAIVMLAALVPHLVQNFQIDTDRWRHLFMLYGLCWGVAAISRRWLNEYQTYAHQAYQARAYDALIGAPSRLSRPV